jgi:site-specific DNA-methyltransferase (adenine-specific)
MSNALYYGDNLSVLRDSIATASIDLIYLDPPFNSQANYNVLFKSPSGKAADAQIEAFEDTWHWGERAERAFADVLASPATQAAELLRAMRSFLGKNDMMAYLTMMAVRLIELHRVLKPTGSLYLHCDPTASHYLKILLDGIFGPTLFRNEIVWQRSMPKGHAFTRFPSAHDSLLSYGRSDQVSWNAQFLPHRSDYIHSHYGNVEHQTGRRYMLDNCLNPNPDRPNLTYEWKGVTRVWRWTKEKMQALEDEGRLIYTRSGMPRYKRYLDEMAGTPLTSVWTDIPPINSQAQERLGYPTQKPVALLERIIGRHRTRAISS